MELQTDILIFACGTPLAQFHYVPQQFDLRRNRLVICGVKPAVPHLLLIITHIIWKTKLVF